MRAILGAILLLIPAKLLAGPPVLTFPLDCTLGETCFTQQYVDTDPGPGDRDFTCGPLSYDGHKGTDFRLAHRREILGDGVAVLASSTGTVLGTRNTMPDIAQGGDDAPDISNRECGNGVVIDHGDGWRTQYCHMRQGSISVKTGQQVVAGEQLGLVGLSGLTQFPHLHIKLTHNDVVVDPFSPDLTKGCGETTGQLWDKPIEYQPGGLLSAGFADHAISFADVTEGPPQVVRLSCTVPAIVLWGYFFGVQADDQLRIEISNPDGTDFLNQSFTFDRQQSSAYRLAGKRLTKTAWPVGTYTGQLTFIRAGTVLSQRLLSILVVAE